MQSSWISNEKGDIITDETEKDRQVDVWLFVCFRAEKKTDVSHSEREVSICFRSMNIPGSEYDINEAENWSMLLPIMTI